MERHPKDVRFLDESTSISVDHTKLQSISKDNPEMSHLHPCLRLLCADFVLIRVASFSDRLIVATSWLLIPPSTWYRLALLLLGHMQQSDVSTLLNTPRWSLVKQCPPFASKHEYGSNP